MSPCEQGQEWQISPTKRELSLEFLISFQTLPLALPHYSARGVKRKFLVPASKGSFCSTNTAAFPRLLDQLVWLSGKTLIWCLKVSLKVSKGLPQSMKLSIYSQHKIWCWHRAHEAPPNSLCLQTPGAISTCSSPWGIGESAQHKPKQLRQFSLQCWATVQGSQGMGASTQMPSTGQHHLQVCFPVLGDRHPLLSWAPPSWAVGETHKHHLPARIQSSGRGLRKVGPESCVWSIEGCCAAAGLCPLPSGMGEHDDRHSQLKYAWYIPGVLFKSPGNRKDIWTITSVLVSAQDRKNEP